MMTSDWAKRLANQKKQTEEASRIQQQKDLSDRKMLTDHSRPMWEELCREIEKAASDISAEMGDKEYIVASRKSPMAMLITRKSTPNLYVLEFDSGIWTATSTFGARYSLTVIPGNGVVWNGRYRSEQVAQEIIEGLI